MTAPTPAPAPAQTGWRAALSGRWLDVGGLRYGALGAPLAFAALPLYVVLPNHYSAQLGVPLAALGAVLLATRALDALVDPWIGRGIDRALAGPRKRVMAWALLGALLLGGGMAALFFPVVQGADALLAWCAAALVVTSLGYSGLGVLHQAWGARLGGGARQQARLVGWREGLSLAGVLLASTLRRWPAYRPWWWPARCCWCWACGR